VNGKELKKHRLNAEPPVFSTTRFKLAWSKLDPTATGYIQQKDIGKLLHVRHWKTTQSTAVQFIEADVNFIRYWKES
jgi:hypothetical protein